MSAVVYQGAVAPEALPFTVTQGSSGIDLSTVIAAELTVRLPDRTTVQTWAATISNKTVTGLLLTHVYQVSDTLQLGNCVVVAKLTVPGGIVRTTPQILTVLEPFAA